MKSKEGNTNGLHIRYIISKADGSPVNPKNKYFVLKIEGEGHPEHIRACRIALLKYADEIEAYLPQLAKEIRDKYLIKTELNEAII